VEFSGVDPAAPQFLELDDGRRNGDPVDEVVRILYQALELADIGNGLTFAGALKVACEQGAVHAEEDRVRTLVVNEESAKPLQGRVAGLDAETLVEPLYTVQPYESHGIAGQFRFFTGRKHRIDILLEEDLVVESCHGVLELVVARLDDGFLQLEVLGLEPGDLAQEVSPAGVGLREHRYRER
jgi:hypothetical protein